MDDSEPKLGHAPGEKKVCAYCGLENEENSLSCNGCEMNEFKAPGIGPEKKRLEPFNTVSVLLALFVMMSPLEADFLVPMLHRRQFIPAMGVYLFCFTLVFTLFGLSYRRYKREPDRWRGRGYLFITGSILMLNLLFGGFILFNVLAEN